MPNMFIGEHKLDIQEASVLTAGQLTDIINLQSALVAADFDPAEFMAVVTSKVLGMVDASGAAIELHENDEMVYHAGSGTIAQFGGFRIPFKGSLSGLSVEKNEVLYSADTSTDPRVNAEACQKINALSMLVVPLSRRGEPVGVLKVVSTEKDAFGESALQTLKLIAGLLGGALGQQLEVEIRRQAEEELRHIALHDTLTGLPNRKLFYDRLEHALVRRRRQNSWLGLMYLDIDKFKGINDTYGHAVGDLLLKAFADRVGSVLRASDTLARLGGDEFTIIAENLADAEAASNIASKIVLAMSIPFVFEEATLTVGTSIGIALNHGEPINADEFVHQADEALYEAKRAGRNTYRLAA